MELMLALPGTKQQRPKSWIPIRRALEDFREGGKDHVNFETYAQICTQNGIETLEGQKLFSQTMHRLGIMVHYWDELELRDFVVLNPLWAVKALYQVLEDGRIEQNGGVFWESDLLEYWKDYQPAEQSKLKQLMFKDRFEVCYQTPRDAKKFIAPQLLPLSGPGFALKDEAPLQFRIRYNFLPHGTLARLIVRLNEKIQYDGEKPLAWKKGMVVERRGNVALISMEKAEKQGFKAIDIAIGGPRRSRKDLLEDIREEIKQVNQRPFRGLEIEELIPCPCRVCREASIPEYYKLENLYRYKAHKKETIECHRSMEVLNVSELLEGFPEAVVLDEAWQDGKSPFSKGYWPVGMEAVRGKSRPEDPALVACFKAVNQHIKKGNIEKALNDLISFLEESGREAQIGDLYALLGRWNRNESQNRKGVLENEQYNLETNRIVEAIRGIMDREKA